MVTMETIRSGIHAVLPSLRPNYDTLVKEFFFPLCLGPFSRGIFLQTQQERYIVFSIDVIYFFELVDENYTMSFPKYGRHILTRF